jgi:DNA-binding NarL/FixJ family response regulator
MSGQLLTKVLRRDKDLDVTDGTGKPIEGMMMAEQPQVAIFSDRSETDSHDGFTLLQRCRAFYPNVRVVMLLDRSEVDSVVMAFRNGARGVFCRCDPLHMLPKCIHCVHANQIWISSSQLDFVMEALAQAPVTNPVGVQGKPLLSKRESQVVRWLAEGLSNREISKELDISEHTVKNYLFRIFNKLGVSSRLEVVLYATSQRASSEKIGLKSA